MKRTLCLAASAALLVLPLDAQTEQDSNVIYERPPPVIVNGKPASELTEEEMREFLQEKIREVEQPDGVLELLRIAPGYALTLSFDQPLHSVVIGDPAMLSWKQQGKVLVLSATRRQGDTTLQVGLPGGRFLHYHVFIEPNFLNAMTALRVTTPEPTESRSDPDASGQSGYRRVARIVANYDALLRERALSRREVARQPVMRKSLMEDFEYYDFYKFADGSLALTFLYKNASRREVRLEPSRLRLQMGNLQFLPSFASFHRVGVPAEGTSSGFAYFEKPPFSPDQPFELVFR